MDETAQGDAQADAPAPAPDDLLSRLEVIEAQPLRTRASAYAAVHEELARQLESGPGAPAP